MRLLTSSENVARWWDQDARLRPRRSKGIYITPPMRVDGYHPWHRLRVWLEGVPAKQLQMYLDGRLVSEHAGPPYLLGSEDASADGVIPPGQHDLRVRAKDGDGWLEQAFKITGAG